MMDLFSGGPLSACGGIQFFIPLGTWGSRRFALLGDVGMALVYVPVAGRCSWLSLAEGQHGCVLAGRLSLSSFHFFTMCFKLAFSCCLSISVVSSLTSAGCASSTAPTKVLMNMSESIVLFPKSLFR